MEPTTNQKSQPNLGPEKRKLNRDCPGVLIPAGTPVMLPKDTEIVITQALGGSYTVNVFGNLVRINHQDADALGEEVVLHNAIELKPGEKLTKEHVLEQLSTCYDPEIPVNIVDLGLIYECDVNEIKENEYHINIKMTLTAPGCGIGPFLIDEIEHKTRALPGVSDVKVELVFDPPWSQDMMSEAAKLQLGLI